MIKTPDSVFHSSQTNLKDDENYCSHCRTIVEVKINYSGGYRSCQSCGLVLEMRMIDPTEEYRNFAEENKSSNTDPRRVGFPVDFSKADGGLDLKIEGGKSIPISDSFHRRMNLLDNKESARSSSYYRGAKLIGIWCEALYLVPRVASQTTVLYETLKVDRKTLRGYSVEQIAAALLWAACKKLNQILEFSALQEVTGIDAMDIKKTYHRIMGTEKIVDLISEPTTCEQVKRVPYGLNIARKLDVSDETCALIERLENNLNTRGTLEGRNPNTIAGISAYIICALSSVPHQARTWKQIASASDISEATLKKGYKVLCENGDLQKVVPQWEGMKPLSALKN